MKYSLKCHFYLKIYNNLNTEKFFTNSHTQINDEKEHEKVLERPFKIPCQHKF